MSSLKPIVLYSHVAGPNPWKVAIILQELDLPYDTKFMDLGDIKKEPYISLNPNGRVPAIEDPNTGVTLAESGAILQYLVDTYDKEGKLHHTTLPEKYLELQWLHFQMSGQGPYYGQKSWFNKYHPEKLPSAEARYEKEIRRIIGVIDAHLIKQNTEYLVSNKATYADLAWINWNLLLGWLVPDLDAEREFPAFAAWHQKLLNRPAVVKVLEDKAMVNAYKGALKDT